MGCGKRAVRQRGCVGDGVRSGPLPQAVLIVPHPLHTSHQITTRSDIYLTERAGYFADALIASGSLGAALEKFKPEPEPVWLVYPQTRHLSPKVRVFVDFTAAQFRAALVRRADQRHRDRGHVGDERHGVALKVVAVLNAGRHRRRNPAQAPSCSSSGLGRKSSPSSSGAAGFECFPATEPLRSMSTQPTLPSQVMLVGKLRPEAGILPDGSFLNGKGRDE
jgi:hypothetical protein